MDNVSNFAVTTISPIDNTATSVTVSDASRFPAAPFNAVIWDSGFTPDSATDTEIVRVTAISGTTFTVVRGQEGTTAVAHNVSGKTYKIMLPVTAKSFTEIQSHLASQANPHQVTASQIGAITKVQDDTSPQLGGNLNSNGHIVVDRDTAISNTTFNKAIQSAKLFKRISFDSYDMINSDISGSGSTIENFGISTVKTGTTSGSYARLNFNTMAGVGLYSGDKLAYYMYTGGLSGDTISYVGYINGLTLTTQSNHTLTTRHVGLWYDNGHFYTSSADGTNQQLTDVTPLISSQNWFKVEEAYGHINFYWGDTLIATHTTYVVTGGYQQWWVYNKTNSIDIFLNVYNFVRRGLA